MRIQPFAATLALSALTIALDGANCNISLPDEEPPPEAVLAGTWKVDFGVPNEIAEFYMTFDQNGEFAQITYKIGSGTTITDDKPFGWTEVNGNSVTISNTIGGTGRTFTGTFNDDKTVIDATSKSEIKIGSQTISTEEGPVTFTKQ